jgi:glycosyltransferase involved in cell wall biosynthesis
VSQFVTHPTVVLGVPALNEAKFIWKTLDSIQRQTHADFAVLISDNGSTDDTAAICERFAAEDPRFHFFRQPNNIGSSNNFNFLRKSTDSPFFAWVGGHDMLHPDYLRNHLAALNAAPQIGASFTFWDFIDETDALLRRGCDVGTATPQWGPFLRYLWSAALAIDLGPMHGVYRRSCICDLPMRNCPACDHILLSNCFYLAPFKCIPGHLYKLREFDESKRSQNVMQRITGKSSAVLDMQSAIDGYLEDFDKIVPPDSWHRHMKPLVKWALHDRFVRQRFQATKLIRSTLKRSHEFKRLCMNLNFAARNQPDS